MTEPAEGRRMYVVEWDDREGIRHEMTFRTREDAVLEAQELERQYDFVIVTEADW